ncbi:hypothetical protein MMC24_001257 [Lignoscripta atroalba]|nr:hypothetical protein [Lignoscripta atroalba]
MVFESPKHLHVLLAEDGTAHQTSFIDDIADRLNNLENVRIKCLSPSSPLPQHRPIEGSSWYIYQNEPSAGIEQTLPQDAEDLAEWADFLVVAPTTADTIAKMLHGVVENPLLELLRSWDVSKKVLLLPGMSSAMWENPMTKKQLSKIHRKWKWVRVLEPALWSRRRGLERDICNWDGFEEVVRIIENQVDLYTLGHELNATSNSLSRLPISHCSTALRLPEEIWTIILEYLGDWEVAKALGIYTNLPTPVEWYRPFAADAESSAEPQKYFDLESAILTGHISDITRQLEAISPLRWLSKLCLKLIIKFARVDVLRYLESRHNDLFWSAFGHKLLPTKASAIFGQVGILEWWCTSPSFLTKEYDADAMDGASKAGFVHVLDWWRNSGLPLRYTEASLEQASSKGNIAVLEWWRNAASLYPSGHQYHVDTGASIHSSSAAPLRLKIGKSLIFAAQNGQAATLHWWSVSNLPTPHEDSIARIASAFGHVNVLETWKVIKGDKMQFDNQVLVGATKNGHVDVLEWWKRSGFRVEYKTCDVEEALEDCLGGDGEESIRAWWAKNGLNLGVGTSEWMKVKLL